MRELSGRQTPRDDLPVADRRDPSWDFAECQDPYSVPRDRWATGLSEEDKLPSASSREEISATACSVAADVRPSRSFFNRGHEGKVVFGHLSQAHPCYSMLQTA